MFFFLLLDYQIIATEKICSYRRLYLCDRFFEQKMADFVGCTTPEGEICELNIYFVHLT